MLMWGMEMADKNRKERGFLQRMVPRSAVVSQLPACGPSWTLSVGEVKFKKTQLVKHTHRPPFSHHLCGTQMVDKEDFEAFLKTWQGQIAQVRLFFLPARGSIICCPLIKMCCGAYMSEDKDRKPSKPSK